MKRTLLASLALTASGCAPPCGPFEAWQENGQEGKGVWNIGEAYG